MRRTLLKHVSINVKRLVFLRGPYYSEFLLREVDVVQGEKAGNEAPQQTAAEGLQAHREHPQGGIFKRSDLSSSYGEIAGRRTNVWKS